MATPESSTNRYGAHVVTKPNPGVIGNNKDEPAHSSAELLRRASKAWTILPEKKTRSVQTNKQIGPESRQVLFQSFKDMDEKGIALVPYGNGLVDGIIRAF